MTLRSLEIFVAVCENKGITAAAEKLYLAQPVVSMSVKELESYYGTKLFDRISKRVYLTDDGKELFSYASHIISLVKEAEDKLKSHRDSGEVRIGSSITIGTHYMPIITKIILSKYPDCSIKVNINSSAIIEEMLLNNRLDFAVIEGIVQSKYIISKKICDDSLVPVFSNTHRFCNESNISLDDFFSENFLLREPSSGTRTQFDSATAIVGKKIVPIWESTSTLALINAVAYNLGISVLPYRLVENDLKSGRLCTANIEGLAFKRYFSLIYHKNKHVSPSMKNCIKVCEDCILNSYKEGSPL